MMPGGEPETVAARSRTRRMLAITLLVGAIGPLIGMLGVLVTITMANAAEKGDYGDVLMAPLLIFTPFTLYAYIFGGPPALVTGLALAALDRHSPSLCTQLGAAALTGALASLIWQPIITGSASAGPPFFLPIFLPIVGAGSAIVCAVLVRAILRRA